VAIAKADAPFLKGPAAAGTPAASRGGGGKTTRATGAKVPRGGPYRLVWLRLRLRVFGRAGDYKEARAAARELHGECGAKAGPIAVDLARIHLGLGEPRKARRALAGVSTRNKDSAQSPKIRALSAEIAFALNEPERVGRLILGRDDARALALGAWVSWRGGRFRRAIARASRAIRLDVKQDLAVQVQVAAALGAREPELAESVLRGAATLLGIDVWTLAFAEGVIALKNGKLAPAQRAFRRAAAQCPTCKPPRHNLRILRQALGAEAPPALKRPR